MKTIRMCNDEGVLAEYNPTQAISAGDHGKHFHPMSEVSPICANVDVFGSVDLDDSTAGVAASLHVHEEGSQPGVSGKIVHWPNSSGTDPYGCSAAWDNPSPLGSDVVITVCAKAEIIPYLPFPGPANPAALDTCDSSTGRGAGNNEQANSWGGFISFYMGNPFSATFCNLRVQPYYAVFSHDTLGSGGSLATPFYEPMKVREDGEIYIFSAVKRGSTLEHYANGIFTGSIDVSTANAAVQAAWNAPNWGRMFRCGHSACGEYSGTPGVFTPLPGNNIAVGELEQDTYGFAVSHFGNGAPPQKIISLGQQWMMREWPKDNKKIYPGWMVYA